MWLRRECWEMDTGGSGSLTASLVGNVAHGALTLNANGSFAYTPANGFSGADSFTYQVTDVIAPPRRREVIRESNPPH